MSRGPGIVQNRILEVLRRESSETWTVGKLRWTLFLAEGLSAPKIDTSWNTSFSRAVDTLVASEAVLMTHRRLETFEECVEHYPHKSLQSNLREMRQTMLPHLLEGTKVPGAVFFPKYDECSNEEHHCTGLDGKELGELLDRWKKLESELRPIYGTGRQYLNLLLLMARGAQLFHEESVKVSHSFRSLARTVEQEHSLPSQVSENLRALSRSLLGESDANVLRLKSYIHTFAHMPRTGRMYLRLETMHYLWRRAQTFIENMKGFEGSRLIRSMPGNTMVPMNFPRQLEGLFERNVFEEFRFLAARSRTGSAQREL